MWLWTMEEVGRPRWISKKEATVSYGQKTRTLMGKGQFSLLSSREGYVLEAVVALLHIHTSI
jgi:hypothetical protein